MRTLDARGPRLPLFDHFHPQVVGSSSVYINVGESQGSEHWWCRHIPLSNDVN